MDAYSLGILIRSLITSTGLRNTIVILVVLGIGYGVFKALAFAGQTMKELVASRDMERTAFINQMNQITARTMERVAEQDKVRALHEKDMAVIQERISNTLVEALESSKKTREEMHQRFTHIEEQHEAMGKQLSHIEGSLR